MLTANLENIHIRLYKAGEAGSVSFPGRFYFSSASTIPLSLTLACPIALKPPSPILASR